jgi:hypothetical protein
LKIEEYYYEENLDVIVKVGQIVKQKQILAKSKTHKQKLVSIYP